MSRLDQHTQQTRQEMQNQPQFNHQRNPTLQHQHRNDQNINLQLRPNAHQVSQTIQHQPPNTHQLNSPVNPPAGHQLRQSPVVHQPNISNQVIQSSHEIASADVQQHSNGPPYAHCINKVTHRPTHLQHQVHQPPISSTMNQKVHQDPISHTINQPVHQPPIAHQMTRQVHLPPISPTMNQQVHQHHISHPINTQVHPPSNVHQTNQQVHPPSNVHQTNQQVHPPSNVHQTNQQVHPPSKVHQTNHQVHQAPIAHQFNQQAHQPPIVNKQEARQRPYQPRYSFPQRPSTLERVPNRPRNGSLNCSLPPIAVYAPGVTSIPSFRQRSSDRRCVTGWEYLATLTGALKIMQIICSIIICCLAGIYCTFDYCTSMGALKVYGQAFVVLVGAIGAVVSLSLACLYIFYCCPAFDWRPWEVTFQVCMTVMYLAAAGVETYYASDFRFLHSDFADMWAAAAAFTWVGVVLYGVDVLCLCCMK